MTIKFHLSKLLGEKRIRAAEVSRKTGITKHALSALYNENVKGIRFDTLNRLCKLLNCQISDLLEYIPDNKKLSKK